MRFRPATDWGGLRRDGAEGRAAFSHAGFYDREWFGWSGLRVLNHWRLPSGWRSSTERRANMELLTLVCAGRWQCVSTAGDSGWLEAGQWHLLSSGAGVDVHEQADPDGPGADVLQFWLQPRHSNATSRQQVARPRVGGDGRIAGRDAPMYWDVEGTLWRWAVMTGETRQLPPGPGWVQVLAGGVRMAGRALSAGDGVGLRSGDAPRVEAAADTALLVLQLPLR
jgi:redox-sensitive bicupin YhaK (pirin superfamily)